MNTSQDPEYEGPTYHEKKFHKTHFEVKKTWRGKHPKDDPEWEYIGVGRWRKIPQERINAALGAEVISELGVNPFTSSFDYYEASSAETDPVFSASEAASFVAGDAAKLAGIEAGAEVNNISDVNATDLTDGGGTTLHTHLIAGITDVTAAMGTLVKETNVKGTFINDALIDGANPDMGYETDSNKSGYYTDWITDKVLSNVLIGGSARTDNGGLRVNVSEDPDTLEVYLRGVWNTIIYDFTTANNDLRHTPLSEQIYVWRGDSVAVGLNGRPIISEYEVSMGAFPPPRVLNGGTF